MPAQCWVWSLGDGAWMALGGAYTDNVDFALAMPTKQEIANQAVLYKCYDGMPVRIPTASRRALIRKVDRLLAVLPW
jgi:hypothetical protein